MALMERRYRAHRDLGTICRRQHDLDDPDQFGPEIGPQMGADFPDTLTALARMAES
jgi:hypothetical protein